MPTYTSPRVTALQAQAAANLFLNDHLPDRFTSDHPFFSPVANVWHVPVILAYPGVGPLGQVGEVLIDASTEVVVSHTSLDALKRAAKALYDAARVGWAF